MCWQAVTGWDEQPVAEVLIPLIGASVDETMFTGHQWIAAREDR